MYIISCLKKRRLCYLQSSGILFVLGFKNNKNICQKQHIIKIHRIMKLKT